MSQSNSQGRSDSGPVQRSGSARAFRLFEVQQLFSMKLLMRLQALCDYVHHFQSVGLRPLLLEPSFIASASVLTKRNRSCHRRAPPNGVLVASALDYRH